MFKKWKKVIAAFISSAMILTCAGCTSGKDTAYVMTVDGYDVRAGVYLYYMDTALSEAMNRAAENDEKLGKTENMEDFRKVKIDGKSFSDYVKDKATENCIDHVVAIKHFDELGLTVSDEGKAEIDEYVEMLWESGEDYLTKGGISKESVEEVMTASYKTDEIFKAYYGEGGKENVTDEHLKEHFTENNARVRYVAMDLHDAEGNDLDDAGMKELKDMADDFLKRAKSAKDEAAMLKEFDEFQEEYDDYVVKKAAEAAGEEVPTEASSEAAEDEHAGHDHGDEETAEDEHADHNHADGSSCSNEQIVPVVTIDEDTKEEDVTYTPSKAAYDWIYNKAKTGTPEIVEDEDTLYVIVRLDIADRLTEDDLWNENNVDSIRFDLYSEDLQELLDTLGNEYEVVKNKKAFNRYDPLRERE